MGGGCGSDSDSDDKTVWLDYHNAEIKKRDERIAELEAALYLAQGQLAEEVGISRELKVERDEMAQLLRWVIEKMKADKEKHRGPGFLNDLWSRGEEILARIDGKEPPPVTFTCSKCGRVSHNPNDVQWKYCGACHEFENV
mgnify:CR=1 FL=1